jgi:hypothetical protein
LRINYDPVKPKKVIIKDITLEVLSLKDYFERELERLTEEINNLRNKLIEEEKQDLATNLNDCEKLLQNLTNNIEEEEFINANNNVKETQDCIKEIEDKASKLKELPFTEIKMTEYIVWIITWTLIILLILAIIAVIYILNKKLNLLTYVKQTQEPTTPTSFAKRGIINDKLKNIKERLG